VSEQQTTLDVDELRALVADAIELPVEEVLDDASFVDLEVDSLTALDIMASLEDRYGIKVSDDELKAFVSFASVRDLVAAKLQG
jgi:acyl carrier protein